MKRIVIGSVMMLGGLFSTFTFIIAGVLYATRVTQWSGQSKFWFVIFGRENLYLGFPFIIGLLLTIVGIIILGREYFNTSTNIQINDSSKNHVKPKLITSEIKKRLNELKSAQKISDVEKSFIINNYLTDGKINEVYPTQFKNYYLLDIEGEPHLVVIKNNLALRVTKSHLNKQLELKEWYVTTFQ